MSDQAATILRFWQTAEARGWHSPAEVLADDLLCEREQTREWVRGAFPRFFAEFPGDWHLTTFITYGPDGLSTRFEDVRPEPYERPADRAHLTELV